MASPTTADALLSLSSAELRLHLPQLFQLIDSADEASAPMVSILAERAFEGSDGLAALRDAQTLPFVQRGLSHGDPQVRSLTIAQVQRLATSASNVRLLCERGVLAKVATAVGDDALAVSQRATALFTTCASAGADALRAVLDDGATLNALRAHSDGSVLELRVLALFSSLAAAGDEQFTMVASRELLAPALRLWRAGDPLVQLNAVELFTAVAATPKGVAWLRESGVAGEMLSAVLDVGIGEDALVDLLRPAVLGCIATILELGGAPAADLLLREHSLLPRVWPALDARAPHEQLHAALAVVRAAAASHVGATTVLSLCGAGDAARASSLGALLRAHDERTRVGAMAALAGLVEACAAINSGGGGGGGDGAMDVDGTAATANEALDASAQALVAACSPSESTAAADAIGKMGQSLSDDLRTAALRLLRALAMTPWGAAELCEAEGVLELLLTSETVHTVPADELRLKHSVACELARWPSLLARMGAAAVTQVNAYVAAGPFAPQKARAAKAAAPLTL